MDYQWKFSVVWRYKDILLSGVVSTAFLTILAVALGTILAVGILGLRQSRIRGLSFLAKAFVEVFRDLPVMDGKYQ